MPRLHRICVLLAFSFQQYAAAEIIGVAGGADPPPPTLGPYAMTPFPLDDRPLYELVTDVPSPLGGAVEFSDPLSHRRVVEGGGWAFWGHPYYGDVYYGDGILDYTMYLPAKTMAFYFYAHQAADSFLWITATTDDGTAVEQQVPHFGGAKYFGFYQDDPGGPPIEFIHVSCSYECEVTVGEFGIAIPGPGALVLLGVGGIGAVPRRRC